MDSAVKPGDVNPFLELGIPATATVDEVHAALKRRRFTLHPDRNRNDPRATARFQLLGQVCEPLCLSSSAEVNLQKAREQWAHHPTTPTTFLHPVRPTGAAGSARAVPAI